MAGPSLVTLGHGYSARALARALPAGWHVTGSTRDAARLAELRAEGVAPLLFPGDDAGLRAALTGGGVHLLVSAPPEADGCPVARMLAGTLRAHPPAWIGYLSTTGVYGDHGGDWVDEETPTDPVNDRSARRVRAERDWLALADAGLPVHVFRLAGIYGPGRSALERVAAGTAQRIVKPDQVFSRIHVADIAAVLMASIAAPRPGRVYNVADDLPAPPEDVITHAAELLGLPVPPAIPFEEADLSPMARSFYAESKRVSNARIRTELGVRLHYPDYRAGLAAIREGRDTG